MTKILFFPTLGREDPPREIEFESIYLVLFQGFRKDQPREKKSMSIGLVSFTGGREDPPRERKPGSICLVSYRGGREDPHRERKSMCLHIQNLFSGFEFNPQHSDFIGSRTLFSSHRYERGTGVRQAVTFTKKLFFLNSFYGWAP